jgi:signal peptidase I
VPLFILKHFILNDLFGALTGSCCLSDGAPRMIMEDYRTDLTAAPQNPAAEKRVGYLRLFWDILETLLLAGILFLAINTVSARIRVDGTSMEPTLQNGQFVLVNKLAYRLGSPSRGDVIVFHYPRDPEQEYIKRVIGLSGDKVDIANGQVFVNDELIQEPYIAASPKYGPESWYVPDGSLFVLGDNRNNSSDSHTWGSVPVEYVIGKAFVVYWPPFQWGFIQPLAAATH